MTFSFSVSEQLPNLSSAPKLPATITENSLPLLNTQTTTPPPVNAQYRDDIVPRIKIPQMPKFHIIMLMNQRPCNIPKISSITPLVQKFSVKMVWCSMAIKTY